MIICRAPVASSVAFNWRQTQNRSYGVKASLLYILFHMTLLASLQAILSLSLLEVFHHQRLAGSAWQLSHRSAENGMEVLLESYHEHMANANV